MFGILKEFISGIFDLNPRVETVSVKCSYYFDNDTGVVCNSCNKNVFSWTQTLDNKYYCDKCDLPYNAKIKAVETSSRTDLGYKN